MIVTHGRDFESGSSRRSSGIFHESLRLGFYRHGSPVKILRLGWKISDGSSFASREILILNVRASDFSIL